MGLTIHYDLKTDETGLGPIRGKVRRMHELAKQLPFQKVGGIGEFWDEQCAYDKQGDPDRWLKIQATKYVEIREGHVKVQPLHVVAFTAIVGDGCEPANIGLCRYPDFVQIDELRRRRVRTGLDGWSWGSFCKTQYASDPSVGGTPNFVRCHLCVIALMDAIQKHGIAEVRVSDEGDSWEHRDERKLAETVGEWNAMIAGIAGQIKDAAAGLKLDAPITQYPNFEHLEADAQAKLKDGLA